MSNDSSDNSPRPNLRRPPSPVSDDDLQTAPPPHTSLSSFHKPAHYSSAAHSSFCTSPSASYFHRDAPLAPASSSNSHQSGASSPTAYQAGPVASQASPSASTPTTVLRPPVGFSGSWTSSASGGFATHPSPVSQPIQQAYYSFPKDRAQTDKQSRKKSSKAKEREKDKHKSCAGSSRKHQDRMRNKRVPQAPAPMPQPPIPGPSPTPQGGGPYSSDFRSSSSGSGSTGEVTASKARRLGERAPSGSRRVQEQPRPSYYRHDYEKQKKSTPAHRARSRSHSHSQDSSTPQTYDYSTGSGHASTSTAPVINTSKDSHVNSSHASYDAPLNDYRGSSRPPSPDYGYAHRGPQPPSPGNRTDNYSAPSPNSSGMHQESPSRPERERHRRSQRRGHGRQTDGQYASEGPIHAPHPQPGFPGPGPLHIHTPTPQPIYTTEPRPHAFPSGARVLRTLTLLIEDTRRVHAEPVSMLAEVRAPLRQADDPEDGWWAEAEEVAGGLQSGPGRIDGCAKVYVLRGKYRQYFLRVGQGGSEGFQCTSANLKATKERTMELFIEDLPPADPSNDRWNQIERQSQTQPQTPQYPPSSPRYARAPLTPMTDSMASPFPALLPPPPVVRLTDHHSLPPAPEPHPPHDTACARDTYDVSGARGPFEWDDPTPRQSKKRRRSTRSRSRPPSVSRGYVASTPTDIRVLSLSQPSGLGSGSGRHYRQHSHASSSVQSRYQDGQRPHLYSQASPAESACTSSSASASMSTSGASRRVPSPPIAHSSPPSRYSPASVSPVPTHYSQTQSSGASRQPSSPASYSVHGYENEPGYAGRTRHGHVHSPGRPRTPASALPRTTGFAEFQSRSQSPLPSDGDASYMPGPSSTKKARHRATADAMPGPAQAERVEYPVSHSRTPSIIMEEAAEDTFAGMTSSQTQSNASAGGAWTVQTVHEAQMPFVPDTVADAPPANQALQPNSAVPSAVPSAVFPPVTATLLSASIGQPSVTTNSVSTTLPSAAASGSLQSASTAPPSANAASASGSIRFGSSASTGMSEEVHTAVGMYLRSVFSKEPAWDAFVKGRSTVLKMSQQLEQYRYVKAKMEEYIGMVTPTDAAAAAGVVVTKSHIIRAFNLPVAWADEGMEVLALTEMYGPAGKRYQDAQVVEMLEQVPPITTKMQVQKFLALLSKVHSRWTIEHPDV